MKHLPTEMWLHVLSFATPKDLVLRWSVLSESWRHLANDDPLWVTHLDRHHPQWRAVVGGMGFDIEKTARRECFRLMSPHDPAERRVGCCQHDVTKGAACCCCTCRRYHSDQRWDASSDDDAEVVEIKGLDDETTMANTYDANFALFDSMVTDVGVDEVQHFEEALTIAGLEDRGLLKRRTLPNGTEAVIWTEKAHRTFRPPLSNSFSGMTEVTYTNAQLYTTLKKEHPELCGRTALDAHANLLSWFDGEYQSIEDKRDELNKWWSDKEFDEGLSVLVDAGWLERLDNHARWTPAGEYAWDNEMREEDDDPME
jgi:hypothetical protein